MHQTGTKSVATLIIGAGELGSAMLRAFSETTARISMGSVSVLLRPKPSSGDNGALTVPHNWLQETGVRTVRADLATESEDNLAVLFSEFSVIICCTGFVGGFGSQLKITRAVLKARVERYVPWQFGIDYDAIGRGSGQELFDEQIDVRDMLRAQSETHWTIVSTGIFTSFLFDPSFGLVDLEKGQVHALGRWSNRLTVTTTDDVGRLTASILGCDPPIIDTVVFVAGDTFSYAELADMVQRHLGRSIERVLWNVKMLQAKLAADPGDNMWKYRLAFARNTGVAWEKEETFNFAQGIPVTDVPTWLKNQRR